MAKTIDHDWDADGNRRHPWEEWFNGECWLINQAEDFPHAKPSTMRIQLYNQATRRGKVKVHMQGDEIIFQFFPNV